MPEDLTTAEPGPITEEELEEGEVEYDEKDYAGEAYNLMAIYETLMSMDLKVLNATEMKKIMQMKKYCIRVAYLHVKMIYEENFTGDED